MTPTAGPAAATCLALVRSPWTFAALAALVAMGGVGVVERLWPARQRRPARDGANLMVWALGLGGQALLHPAIGGAATLAVNALGGGWIVLPSRGPGLIVGAAVYVVAMDLGEYLFHRAQHAVPVLWTMHSLHHSDTAFDSTTTVRHFWAEPVLKALTVWLAVGLAFRASGQIVAVYALASYWNYVVHSNTRLDFGRASWALNAPAYHRLHHSASPEHFGVNFAALLPIFDLISGTYRPARPGERPATGLGAGQEALTPWSALAWPARRWLRRPAERATPAPTP